MLARNRLSKVILPDGKIATYSYDPFGRRIKKDVDGQITRFAYADEGLIGEYDSSGTPQKAYGWKPDTLWGTDPLYQVSNGQFAYYHNDHLFTPQRLTNDSGQIVWSAVYQAFGKAWVDPLLSTVTNNLRFPGQYEDQETGENYNLQRYYNPIVGKYTQVDTIRFEAGDVNVYRYVRNGSTVSFDPTGEAAIAIPIIIEVLKDAPLILAAMMAVKNAADTIPKALDKVKNDCEKKICITYVLYNPNLKKYYIGRASGYGTPEQVMNQRYSSHHMRAQGYNQHLIDRATNGGCVYGSTEYFAIRGREQQLLDYYGGVGNIQVANVIRAVSKLNPLRKEYHEASNMYFVEELSKMD